mmetsp:Transcript_34954/g.112665  ORF Transcript_34954/g.112665 Transcript_34954/m.112665 type:complete len:205 (-) Transcript_34954:225-839(-)
MSSSSGAGSAGCQPRLCWRTTASRCACASRTTWLAARRTSGASRASTSSRARRCTPVSPHAPRPTRWRTSSTSLARSPSGSRMTGGAPTCPRAPSPPPSAPTTSWKSWTVTASPGRGSSGRGSWRGCSRWVRLFSGCRRRRCAPMGGLRSRSGSGTRPHWYECCWREGPSWRRPSRGFWTRNRSPTRSSFIGSTSSASCYRVPR